MKLTVLFRRFLLYRRELGERVLKMGEELGKKLDTLSEVLLIRNLPETEKKIVCAVGPLPARSDERRASVCCLCIDFARVVSAAQISSLAAALYPCHCGPCSMQ